ncbi:MAG: glycosyltransferase, partial [Verrucomicrobia bacterium]|nr:glycosyltransferase [Verrucomicrobiota bacterium]
SVTGLGPIRLGFVDPEDEGSRISLKAHAESLTHLAVPGWVLDETGSKLEPQSNELEDLNLPRTLQLMPVLSNDAGGKREPEPVESLLRLADREQTHLVQELVAQAQEIRAHGVMVDWGEIDPSLRDPMNRFFGKLSTMLHAKGLEFWVVLPVGRELEVFDLDSLSRQADRMVAMLHDETGEFDPPGPIASLDWFEGWLKAMISYGNPEQWVISLGLHGYDWTQGSEPAETLGFYDALARAHWAGLPRIEAPGHSDQPHFAYREGNQRHDVWFLDAVTLANQMEILKPYSPGGIGLWKLGLEDHDIWKVLEAAGKRDLQMADLPRIVRPTGTIGDVGDGDALAPYLDEKEGHRTIAVMENGHWRAGYDPLPQPASVIHSGGSRPNQVALTFDDGPDPEWTPQILDILRREKVSATFFVVGEKAESEPSLIQRILQEGHELGNHTFTHPNLSQAGDGQIRLELNATRRLLEGITGRSLLFFRPPYNADSNPQTAAELRPLRIARQLGYLTIGQSVDSKDWEKPGAESILEAVKEGRAHGQTILFHDAGGDREQTVEALPQVIRYLRSRGDEMVTVGTLLGMGPAETMPYVSAEKTPLAWLSHFVFWIWRMFERSLGTLLILTTSLLALRMGMVWWGSRPSISRGELETPQGVSVILPAYNEARVLRETLGGLARTKYPGPVEFIVVDDGSTDSTLALAREVAREDARFTVLHQSNQGKAAALNRGLAVSQHPWVVTLDADTRFEEGTIVTLVRWLEDSSVGAVSGRVRVGNRNQFLPALQELEYSAGFHLDRVAYARWNCITVVPGAISALRKSALQPHGGFSEDTMAEDADLTLALHRDGWRIAYAAEAVARTEAPSHPGALLRQRRRWTYGTLQSIWKHRVLLFSFSQPWLGWMALPSVLITQTFLAVAVPLVDLGVLWALWKGQFAAWLPWCLAFSLLMDGLPVAVALRKDGESLWALRKMIWMRAVYRPLLAMAVWAALWKTVTGRWISWRKLERPKGEALPQLT